MTDVAANSQTGRRYRLRTFGTLALTGADGTTLLGNHGHQRYRLALLAVLAAAGEHGRSRDQLLGLFWPDAAQAKARHSLDQLLYAIRSSIDEAVFVGVNPVRLNPDVISTDVGDFRQAIQRGDPTAAVETRIGEFLDGFYLDDSPDFDYWLDTERARLSQSYYAALERLATEAEQTHEHSIAVKWWRKLAEADPVSGRYAMSLMRALMNAGDHAAALRFAEHYESVVEEELGTSAGPAVAKLVAELRARNSTPRIAIAPAHTASEIASAIHVSDETVAKPVESAHQRRSMRRKLAVFGLAAASIAAIAGAASWKRIAHARPITLSHSTNRDSTRNVAAYELYRRGNDQTLLRSDSGARAGLEYFRQAIALDPTFAAAYAGLARAHKRIAFGDDRELSRPARLALAEEAAVKAVALDDSSGDAHATLSLVRRDNYEMASAETELRIAVELEPANPRFREYMVQLYVLMGRAPEALIQGRRALELDPLGPTAHAELAHALLANRRCEDALAQLEKLKSLRPPLNRAAAIAAQCYGRMQRWSDAIAEMQRVSPNSGPRGQAILGYMLARGGRTSEARRILGDLRDRSRRINGGAFDVALVFAGLGDNDQALDWLNKAVEDRSVGFEWLPTVFDDLSADPRFGKVRQRLGLDDG